jgi:hypothetical protein
LVKKRAFFRTKRNAQSRKKLSIELSNFAALCTPLLASILVYSNRDSIKSPFAFIEGVAWVFFFISIMQQGANTRLRHDPTDYARKQQAAKERAKELRDQRQKGTLSEDHTFAPK